MVENYPISLSQCVKPLTPISDQDKISPHNIKTISSRQVMTVKKNLNQGLLVDPMPNSLN